MPTPPLRGHASGEGENMPSKQRAGHATPDNDALPESSGAPVMTHPARFVLIPYLPRGRIGAGKQPGRRAMVESAGAASRTGTRLLGVLIALVAVAILVSLIVYAIQWVTEVANRTSCKSNLMQMGSYMYNWALTHGKVWPDMQESERWDDVGNTRTDAWSPARDVGEPPAIEPGYNGMPIRSNTASLWQLVRSAGFHPAVFVCPSVRERKSITADCNAPQKLDRWLS
jgi:hypothetical protein